MTLCVFVSDNRLPMALAPGEKIIKLSNISAILDLEWLNTKTNQVSFSGHHHGSPGNLFGNQSRFPENLLKKMKNQISIYVNFPLFSK